MKRKILITIGFFSALLIAGCYPGGPDYTEELDVVLTYHNPDYNFGTKPTYAMPDKIVKIEGNLLEGGNPGICSANRITLTQMLDEIENNMSDPRLEFTKNRC